MKKEHRASKKQGKSKRVPARQVGPYLISEHFDNTLRRRGIPLDLALYCLQYGLHGYNRGGHARREAVLSLPGIEKAAQDGACQFWECRGMERLVVVYSESWLITAFAKSSDQGLDPWRRKPSQNR